MPTEQPALPDKLHKALRPTFSAPGFSWLWQPLLRLLACGHPVTVEDLAEETSRSPEEVREGLASVPDTEYDETGRIVGHGITQRPTQHQFTVGGHALYTWCALDTLIFPGVLGRTAEVESTCQATGTPIRLTVSPSGITHLEPASTVVSIVTPSECTSVRSALCDHTHFFASPEAARDWYTQHPDAVIVPADEAFAAGQRLIDTLSTGKPPDCC